MVLKWDVRKICNLKEKIRRYKCPKLLSFVWLYILKQKTNNLLISAAG